MNRVRRRGRVRKRVQIGAPDPSLTATSGVAAIAEFVDKLDVVGVLDRGIGSIKRRDARLRAMLGAVPDQRSGGQLLDFLGSRCWT